MTNLLNGISTAPGRVRTFLEHPEYKTTPHSCSLIRYNDDPVELIRFVIIALKGGAGVKIIFPAVTDFNSTVLFPSPIRCTIDRTHDDYQAIKQMDGFIEVEDAGDDSNDDSIFLKPRDTIIGTDGILDCLSEVYYHTGNKIVVDLSYLRPAKTINKSGMESSGCASFWQVFQYFHAHCESPSIESLLQCLGQINSTMRRGGYKKGIVTSAMDYRCGLIDDYLDIDITTLQGSHKTGIIIDDGIVDNQPLIDRIIEKRNTQSLFIEKRLDDETWMNVCEGIALGDRGTCLIWRVNLGLCKTFEDIRGAFATAMHDLVDLHLTWRDSKSNPGIYADLADDRQVGLDVMGLANYLSLNGISYLDFVEILELHTDVYEWHYQGIHSPNSDKIYGLIDAIADGYKLATSIADSIMADTGNLAPLDRLFTVEPAQSHAYETVDSAGFTTCRGIFAPFGRLVNRTSESESNRTYNHGNVEIAGEIGANLQIRLCNAWQTMMDETGRAHSISQDTYAPMDREGFAAFLNGASKSLYYAEHDNYNQRKHLAKSIAVCTLDDKDGCQSCGE